MPAPLMIVGEAPGEHEDSAGIPFIGQSGKLLRTTLSELGATGDRIFITNTVRCRPPGNRDPHPDELDACRFWFEQELEAVQPLVILAAGRFAQKQLAAMEQDGLLGDAAIVNVLHPAARNIRNKDVRAHWQEQIAGAIALAGLGGEFPPTQRDQSPLPGVSWVPPRDFQIAPWTWDEPDLTAQWLACDTETKTLEEGHYTQMVCFQLSDGGRASLYLAPARLPDAVEHVWLHNAKYDLPLLGIDPYAFERWDDTMIVAYLLREDRVGLKILGPKYTGIDMISIKKILTGERQEPVYTKGGRQATEHGEPKFKTVKWERTFDQALWEDPEPATEYALKDAVVTSRLAQALMPKLEANPRLLAYYHEVEKPTVPILLKMEQRGVLVSEPALTLLDEQLSEDIECASQLFREIAGPTVNINSRRQIANALALHGVPLTKRTRTGEIATGEDILLAAVGAKNVEDVTNPLLRAYLDYVMLAKLKTTYVDGLMAARDPSGRVHARFNQTVTDTGRLSSSDPNLMNIPSRTGLGTKVRKAFVAPEGYKLVKADFSQLQPRVYADYTQERVMVDAYCGTPERDLYQAIADELEITRFQAKNGVLLPALFGASDYKIAESCGVPQSQVGPFMKRMKERIPSLHSSGWASRITRCLEDNGYVETRLGRRQEYPLFDSPIGRERAEAIRQAQCYPIQGTEAEIVKLWLIEVDHELRIMGMDSSVHLVLQVHDEGVWECPEDITGMLAMILDGAAHRIGGQVLDRVALKVEISQGPNWGEMGPIGAAA
jgi:uracil-DNA glycosylase family 4